MSTTAINLTGESVSPEWPFRMPLGLVPAGMDIPLPKAETTPVEYAEVLGRSYLAYVQRDLRKSSGHYLTPAGIARFMAECVSYSGTDLRVLDPGSGTGMLSAAVCEAVLEGRVVKRLHVDTYETDPLLVGLTRLVLAFSRQWLEQRGIALTFTAKHNDFVLEYAAALGTRGISNGRERGPERPQARYDLVISNPPYFKIGKDDPRAVAGASVVHGQPNIYALFMAISAELLLKSGMLVYIVPRSFASGPYFRRFREVFFQQVTPTAIHLFESRKDVFKAQTVLQENLILTARRRREGKTHDTDQVLISHSRAAHDLTQRRRLTVGLDTVLDMRSANKELRIPICLEDLELLEVVRAWPNTLSSLGLDISTGPLVPFRATRFLVKTASRSSTSPLLWMHHVRPMRVEWPSTRSTKPQWVRNTAESVKLLVPDRTYVLLRRFSAKEDKRRLVAAPLGQGSLNTDMVGLENHLNYIHGVSREIDRELACGLAALLNSTLLDRCFRVSNGNTQVSATELRAMPLPAEEHVRAIGAAMFEWRDLGVVFPELDAIVASSLNLPSNLWAGDLWGPE